MKKQVFNNFDFIYKANLQFYTSIFGIILLCLVFIFGFSLAKWFDRNSLEQVKSLEKQIKSRDEQLYQLEQKLNFMRVELEVDKLSLQQVQLDLQIKQQENSKLKEQLTFYQNVMAPELTADGVTVDGLFIEPTLIENQYRYRVVLIQTSKQKKFAKGYIELILKGIQKNETATFSIENLKLKDNDLTFSFKYFQILEGEFVLPEAFTPERVELSVTLPKRSGQQHSQTSKDFDWQPEVVHRE